MTGEEILTLIKPEILVVIPVLIIIGMMLKKIQRISDWLIPVLLGAAGIIFSVLILGFENSFSGLVIMNGFLQGILSAGMAVYVHQLTIQSTKKRIED